MGRTYGTCSVCGGEAVIYDAHWQDHEDILQYKALGVKGKLICGTCKIERARRMEERELSDRFKEFGNLPIEDQKEMRKIITKMIKIDSEIDNAESDAYLPKEEE